MGHSTPADHAVVWVVNPTKGKRPSIMLSSQRPTETITTTQKKQDLNPWLWSWRLEFLFKKRKKKRKEMIRHLVSPFMSAIALLGIMGVSLPCFGGIRGSNVISPLTQSGRVSKLACKKFQFLVEKHLVFHEESFLKPSIYNFHGKLFIKNIHHC